MKTVSNNFKLNVNSFGRQLDTLIYDWYKPENGYKPLVGETTQQTTTGKNKLVLTDGEYTNNGVTATVKNGVITLSGANTSSSVTWITLGDAGLQSSTEYIFSTGVTSGLGNSSVRLRCFLGNSSDQISYDNTEVTATTLSTGNSYSFRIRVAGNYDTTGIILKPMIRLSSVSDNTFEPYSNGVVSPSPNCPQEVKTLTGEQIIKYTGKNLFNKNNFDIMYNYQFSTTTTNLSKSTLGIKLLYIPITGGLSYTITKKRGSIFRVGTTTDMPSLGALVSDITVNTNVDSITCNANNNAKYLLCCYYSNNDTSTEQEILDSIMIEQNSTATQYEPYIDKSYEINLGKNLLDITATSQEVNGVQFTINEDGSVYAKGTATAEINFNLTTYPHITIESGKSYYLSGSPTSASSTTYRLMGGCVLENGTNSYIADNTGNGYAVPNTAVNIRVYINVKNGKSIDTTFYPMLEAGTIKTSFAQYKTPIELCKIGNYQDYIYKNNGNWYIHKEIGKVVLNGSEEWIGSPSSGYRRYYTTKSDAIATSARQPIKSNYFEYQSSGHYEGKGFTSGAKIYLYPEQTITTSQEFQTWLGTHNTSVYYLLAEPTNTIIEDEELIAQLEAIRQLNTLNRDNIFNINPNFHTNIMETLMKSMNVETDTLINVDDEIDVYSGVKVGNTYEYINYGHYHVKEYEKDENKKSYTMKCYDDMMLTMVDYDLQVTYPISIKNLLLAIFTHFGFTLNTQTFVNDDNLITTDVFSGMKMTYRDVLSELAIATCSTIEIENDVMYLKYPTNTDLVINEDILNDVNVAISKKYGPVNRLVITRISGVDTELREDTTSIEMYGATELKISDKQIFSTEATRDNMIDEMWYYINDFQYYLCDLDTQGLMYIEALDKFNILINNTLYPTIALNDETNISDGLNEEIFNEEPIINQDKYKYSKPENKSIRDAYIEVDKQNAKINLIAEQTLDPDNPNSIVSQIGTITVQYNEILAQISDIADVTTSAEDTDAQIELDDINASEPITLKIHPTGENISYLYPRSNIFPSSTTYLKTRKIRFYNTTSEEIIYDYELPEDLLYYDSENYDEFLLDYGDGSVENRICQVTKKCKYNADGTVGLLATPEIHDYSSQYPTINLTGGNYVISILGYTTGYIFSRLMASNIYTTQFATKVEMNSAIDLKANQINLVVNQKLDQSDFNSANIVLAINGDGTSSASINANKININGVINAINNNTSTTINGNKITTGTITANQVSSDIITTTNFSAQNINANNITAGTLNVDRIPNLSASKITSGTMSANRINGGSISGVSIGIGSYFKVSNTGIAELTTSAGFLTMGTTTHPYVSALNIAYGGGISFRNSSSQGSAGSARGSIGLSSSNGNLVLTASNYVMCGGSGEGYQIATKAGGYPSTKNLKTNIEKIKYDDIYEDMKNMNIYEYDYKYDGIKEKNKHDFGFIIDELEETNILSKYILNYDRYGKIKGNKLIAYKKGLDAEDFNPKKDGYNFKYKEWDRDTYFKLSLLMIKSLQNKIEKLEEQL